MAAPRPKKRSLSDKLKGMRFMKQREETQLREKLLTEQQEREKAAHWTLETPDQAQENAPLVIIEEGLSDNPMQGRSGRQSYGKFNAVFERRKEESRDGGAEHKKEWIKSEPLPPKEEPSLAGAEPATQHSANGSLLSRKKGPVLGIRAGIGKKERRFGGGRHKTKKKSTLHPNSRFNRENR